ncbi:hypothetical protein ACC754_40130, partial [Rhizobium johnstonii]
QRRWLQIESQLPYAFDQIVSALRTGKPLAIAVNAVADTGHMPASREFERRIDHLEVQARHVAAVAVERLDKADAELLFAGNALEFAR